MTFLEHKVDNLYAGVTSIAVVGSIISYCFAYILHETISVEGAIIWTTLVLVLNMARVYAANLYKKSPQRFSLKGWVNIYFILAISVAFFWGGIFYFLIDKNLNVQTELITIAFILGMITGGAVSNIADKKTAVTYTSFLFFPYLVRIFVENKDNSSFFMFSIILFYFLIISTIINLSKLFDKSVNLALDKDLLLDEVKGKLNLQQELQQERLRSMQNSKLASLGEVAAGIAHEINNPLTISMGKLKILEKLVEQDELKREKTKKIASDIMKANRRIGNIVQSMQKLSRIRDESEPEKFCLNELVEIILPLLDSKLSANKVKFDYDFVEAQILADKSELSQVVINVVKNAVDAIKDRSGERWIEMKSQIENDKVFLYISDCGEGIAEDVLDKIFDPFYTTKDIGEGTGLGLSLSKNIMERNNGSLEYLAGKMNTTFLIQIRKAS